MSVIDKIIMTLAETDNHTYQYRWEIEKSKGVGVFCYNSGEYRDIIEFRLKDTLVNFEVKIIHTMKGGYQSSEIWMSTQDSEALMMSAAEELRAREKASFNMRVKEYLFKRL